MYVAGTSSAGWGAPVRAYTGGDDGFVAKLNSAGVLQWMTFLGGTAADRAKGLAVDTSGKIHITGDSAASWGSPVRGYTAGTDAFAAKLNSSGALQWNTFLGGSSEDAAGLGIAVDGNSNTYVEGYSNGAWGTPIRVYTAVQDAFTVKLNTDGILQWSTFLGGTGDDQGKSIALGAGGSIYIAGSSTAEWGTTVMDSKLASQDGLIVKLDQNGAYLWTTFARIYSGNFQWSAGNELQSIAVDENENIYAAGEAGVHDYTAAYVAKIIPAPAVMTSAVTGVTSYTAESGGNVIDEGRAITARGVCWDNTPNPTVAGPQKTVDGTGTGTFTSHISGPYITPNTKYYVRVYATNSVGTGYGEEFFFTTLTPPTVPSVQTTTPSGVTQTSATSGGNVTADGFSTVTARGVCWSTTSNPTIAGAHTTDGSGTGPFVSSLAGMSPGTTYHVRAYATNAVGNGYGSDLSFTTLGRKNNDFNGDGQADILWRYYGSGGFNCVWFVEPPGSGSPKLQAMRPIATDGIAGLARSKADFDPRMAGDGRGPERFFVDPREAGSPSFLGGASPGPLRSPQMIGPGYARIDQGDLRKYASEVDRSSPQSAVPGEPGSYGLSLIGGVDLPAVGDLNWQVQATGDFNGDCKTDLVWRCYGESGFDRTRNCVWFLNGTAVAGGADLPDCSNTNWQIQGTGDFNNDGRPDLLWRYYGPEGYNCVWFMNGVLVVGGGDLPSVPNPSWKIVSR